MRTTFLLLAFLFCFAASAKPAKTKATAPRVPAASELANRAPSKTSESHKFSGLTLKGQLKKPDLSYIYKRAGLRSEQIVDIPETFDNEIVQDADQF